MVHAVWIAVTVLSTATEGVEVCRVLSKKGETSTGIGVAENMTRGRGRDGESSPIESVFLIWSPIKDPGKRGGTDACKSL